MNNKIARYDSIDQLRGIVIVLMALDHVRNFFSPFPFMPEDVSQTSPELFFTRWVTHFCAPVFVFLAGVGAYLFQQKQQSKKELRYFLLTRGLWLVFIELIIIAPSWTFNIAPFFILQVIWVLGISMICLALLTYCPRIIIWCVAGFFILGHNLLDSISAASFGDIGWLWNILHEPTFLNVSQPGFSVFVAYPLIPWIGVMALGYVATAWLIESEATFSQRCVIAGSFAITLFIGLRLLNIYGDPVPWQMQSRGEVFSLISFLNTQKYPPSLLYLCMTLGPALVFLGALEKYKWRWSSLFQVFGRVPFFFYVLHVPVIHLLAVFWFWSLTTSTGWQLAGPSAFPAGYQPNLWLTYGVWLVVTLGFYFLCRWYAGIKRRHDSWILRYL
ncbi:DUF1624 domain-containing protein [Pleionea sp. CnH1-48]|uniref:DUF1624 domain-containing protein n=1 Tax=Pleionea sp. CnH1-48 TaxID=2954494 RepID=UPI002096ACD3|nr:heparan-alpha-glucosaminide N-acetyltransferase domain-containing protein [Pleionea sp. CnH1-48]MCO7226913.1 heparan-alpha-glucosaminide N-acetyltransferase domain-containing protein [Pleionea sp. CnH1-48]